MHIAKMIGAALVVAGAGCLVNAPSASALECKIGGVVVTSQGDADAQASQCAIDGNDVQGDKALNLLNGGFLDGYEDNWHFVGKSDDGGSAVTATNDVSSGTWVLNPGVKGVFAITLKAGNFFSAYAFNVDFIADAGTFDTQLAILVNDKDKGQDLSHLSLFVFKEDNGGGGGPVPIPLPAGAWLMISFITGFGVLRRIKARASA